RAACAGPAAPARRRSSGSDGCGRSGRNRWRLSCARFYRRPRTTAGIELVSADAELGAATAVNPDPAAVRSPVAAAHARRPGQLAREFHAASAKLRAAVATAVVLGFAANG